MKTYIIRNVREVETMRDPGTLIESFKLTGQDDMFVSDTYHTMDELYEHRISLWIALCKLWEETRSESQWKTEEGRKFFSWRSKLHSDGTGYEGLFILGITLKNGQQLSYHLPESKWNEADFATTLDRAPEWDGHTPADVLDRLKNL